MEIKDFLKWVDDKIISEGMTHKEFAEKSGYSKSQISLIFNGKRNVNRNFCAGVARAFNLDEIEILALAGFSKHKDKQIDYQKQDFISLFNKLSQQNKDKVISYMRFLIKES